MWWTPWLWSLRMATSMTVPDGRSVVVDDRPGADGVRRHDRTAGQRRLQAQRERLVGLPEPVAAERDVNVDGPPGAGIEGERVALRDVVVAERGAVAGAVRHRDRLSRGGLVAERHLE